MGREEDRIVRCYPDFSRILSRLTLNYMAIHETYWPHLARQGIDELSVRLNIVKQSGLSLKDQGIGKTVFL